MTMLKQPVNAQLPNENKIHEPRLDSRKQNKSDLWDLFLPKLNNSCLPTM